MSWRAIRMQVSLQKENLVVQIYQKTALCVDAGTGERLAPDLLGGLLEARAVHLWAETAEAPI